MCSVGRGGTQGESKGMEPSGKPMGQPPKSHPWATKAAQVVLKRLQGLKCTPAPTASFNRHQKKKKKKGSWATTTLSCNLNANQTLKHLPPPPHRARKILKAP